MEFFRKTALAALVSGFQRRSVRLSNITILATGGTIAGGGDSATKTNYTAGKVGVENLVDAVQLVTLQKVYRSLTLASQDYER